MGAFEEKFESEEQNGMGEGAEGNEGKTIQISNLGTGVC